jgi:hypothetical protein
LCLPSLNPFGIVSKRRMESTEAPVPGCAPGSAVVLEQWYHGAWTPQHTTTLGPGGIVTKIVYDGLWGPLIVNMNTRSFPFGDIFDDSKAPSNVRWDVASGTKQNVQNVAMNALLVAVQSALKENACSGLGKTMQVWRYLPLLFLSSHTYTLSCPIAVSTITTLGYYILPFHHCLGYIDSLLTRSFPQWNQNIY